jgi:hypothetical protein
MNDTPIQATVKLMHCCEMNDEFSLYSIYTNEKTARLVKVVAPTGKYAKGEMVLFWDDGMKKDGNFVKHRKVWGERSAGEVEKLSCHCGKTNNPIMCDTCNPGESKIPCVEYGVELGWCKCGASTDPSDTHKCGKAQWHLGGVNEFRVDGSKPGGQAFIAAVKK